MKKVNSHIITKYLLRWAASNASEIVVPNYYLGRWECDVLKISKAGHLYEYEVKVSRADFKNDFKKESFFYLSNTKETKHDNIRYGKRCNRFYYVVPEGLIEPSDVPAGFGLIYFTQLVYTDLRDSKFEQIHYGFKIVKVSSLFKKESCNQALYVHIAQNLSLKLANAKSRI